MLLRGDTGRFVLQKNLDLGLKPCVVINKVDKENCTPEEVHEKSFDLMFELGEEWQLDFPTVLRLKQLDV
jgi:GTP-binding protein